MSARTDRLQALALRSIQRNGRTLAATFTKSNSASYNTATLSYDSVAPSTFQAYVAPVDFKLHEIDNTTIRSGEKQLYVAISSGVPEVGDDVTLGSIKYRILEVEAYETESIVCAYRCRIGI